MKWSELAGQPCPIARALSVFGDRWTLLVLRDCFLGVRRFDEFRERLGLPRAVLTERLRLLADEGVLDRVAYQQGPERHEYRLTAKGRDLYPVLLAIAGWSDRHMAGEAGPPLRHRHARCGQDFHAEMRCSECGEPLDPREVEVRPGAGFADPRARRQRPAGG
ncbi:MAG: helix-turn-helix transcriptional regulator [Sphingomonadales bacterium]|nr:helix-turn-helix transcriptional regulator [Sphingomonadales bacterium]MDE2567500.1 helix-turn-helix transcriptional regulator [Sphingomonadales bacterium]